MLKIYQTIMNFSEMLLIHHKKTFSSKHVINLYSNGISQVVQIKDVKKLLRDIENDPIIKDQMANFACLLEFAFGNFLAPFLVAAHTVNNLDLGDEQGLENEGDESD